MKNIPYVLFVIAMVLQSISAYAQSPDILAGAGDLGEEGSEEIRIEQNDTALAKAVRKALASTAASGEVVWFLKPDDANPLYQSFRPLMMEGLKTLQPQGSGELAWRRLPEGSIIQTTDIHINPQTRGGRYPSAGFVYRSPGAPFTLADIAFKLMTPDPIATRPNGQLGMSGTMRTNTLSITRILVNFGPDGLMNTADDTIYTSGPSNLLGHAIIWRGIANWVQEPLAVWDAHVAARQPYTLDAEYTVGNRPSIRGRLFIVPSTVIPPPPQPLPELRLRVIVGLSPGTDVTPGTTNVAGVNIVNDGALHTGPLQGWFQASTDGGVTWFPWVQDGFTLNLAPGEAMSSSHTWTAGQPDGKEYMLRVRVTALESGRFRNPVIDSQPTPKFRVIPVGPPPQPIQLSVRLLPGSRVTEHTVLTLEGFLNNHTTTLLAVQSVAYEVSVQPTPLSPMGPWQPLQQFGAVSAVGGVTAIPVRSWPAGPPTPTIWHFRLVAMVGGMAFQSASVSVNVIPSATGASVGPFFLVIRHGNSVDIKFNAPPGRYQFEESVDFRTWVAGEQVTIAEGQDSVVQTFPIAGLKKFWRIRQL